MYVKVFKPFGLQKFSGQDQAMDFVLAHLSATDNMP